MPVFLVGKSRYQNRVTNVYTVLRKGKTPVTVHVYNNVPFACCIGEMVIEEDEEAIYMVRQILPEEPGPDSDKPLTFKSLGELARAHVLNVAETMRTAKVAKIFEDSSWILVCDLHAGVFGLCHKESYTWSTVALSADKRPELDSFAFFPRVSGPAADDDQLEARHFNKFKNLE